MAKTKVRLNTKAGQYYNGIELSEVYNRVREDIEKVYPVFMNAYHRAQRNVKFIANDQWTDEEKEAMLRQLRIPFVWNKISQQVNNILGSQLNTKLDAKAIPVEPDDQAAADVDNNLIKWAEQINDLDRIEHEVFKSGMAQCGFGACQVSWEMSDFLDGFPKVERIPVYQMVFDLNNTESDSSNTRWMGRIIPMSRAEAMEEYPEYAQQIEEATATYSFVYNLIHTTAMAMTPMQRATFWAHDFFNQGRDIIYFIEHYEKIVQRRWAVVDGIQNSETQVFDTESLAQNYYDGLVAAYTDGNEMLIDGMGNDRILMVELKKDTIIQSLIIGDQAVSQVETELPTFPYCIYYNNFFDGEFWSYVDGLISPQRFMNRMLAEWDNQVGRNSKGMMTVVPQWLHKGWDVNRVAQARSQSGAVIPVTRHDAVTMHPNQAVSPDFPQLVGLTQAFMMDVGGGQNAFGLQENAAESAKAVKTRQAAASLARLPMFANLRQWRQQVTELLLWNMKQYLGAGQIIRVIGKNLEVEKFIELDTSVLDTIREARTDIMISTAVDSDTQREETFNTWMEFFKTMQGTIPPEIVMPFLTKLNPQLDGELRNELMEMLDFYKQWKSEQQKQAQDQAIQQRALSAVQGEVDRDKIRSQMRPALDGQEQQDLSGAQK